MIRKNNISTGYLDSPLNRSTSKETHKFSKADRFLPQKSFSPNKFYNLPDQLDKRSAGIGYGNKVDIVMKGLAGPARYFIRSQFDEIAQGYRFGMRPQPSREQLKKDYSYNNLRNVDYCYDRESEKKRTPSKSKRTSPPKNNRTPDRFERTNDHTRTLTKEKEVNRSPLNQETNYKRERKSSHRLKYEFAENYLLHNNRTSYTEFLNPRRQSRENHNQSYLRSNEKNVGPKEPKETSSSKYCQHQTFGKEERMNQRERLPPTLGPGSYNLFSQFGENLSYF